MISIMSMIAIPTNLVRVLTWLRAPQTFSFFFLYPYLDLFSLVSTETNFLISMYTYTHVLIKNIVAGYPLIYHHIRSLSQIEQVQHVFLVGKYDPKKFSHFIDDILSEFSFKTVQYIYDDVPKNEVGVIFKHRNRLL